MNARSWLSWPLLVVVLVLVVGWSGLRLNADIFSILPEGSPPVESLRLYQSAFAAPRGLMVSISADSAPVKLAAVDSTNPRKP